jgi:integral membrane protein
MVSLQRLRVIGWLEGTSYVLLLGVAMPLKYLAGQPAMVRVVGWAHGLLFVLFIAAVFDAARRHGWSAGRVMGALIASVLPFGPFVLDRRLRADLEGAAPRQS